jgi:glyoxylase-like metal-dependent hydrolase (beta-lactamase superfamily II)
MKIFAPKEINPIETRASLDPAAVKKLVSLGAEVSVESGLGARCGHGDAAYIDAGATVTADRAAGLAAADLVTRVRQPALDEVGLIKAGAIHISFLDPFHETELISRFAAQQVLVPGQPLHAAGRRWPGWQVLAAPGHDPHSTMLFNEDTGVLLSADALWGNGFGVVFPEVEGEPGFDDVEAVLDLIAGLPVKVVVPGHGAPFADVAAALDRARSRLAAFRASPERHARYAFKVLVKYHLMEEGAMPEADLMVWARATPLLAALLQGQGGVDAAAREGWGRALVDELVAQGAAARKGGILVDA